MFTSSEWVEGAVSWTALPTNGFIAKGAGLLSGEGSIEITTVLPLTSKGKLNPEGALLKKSSPGTGAPGIPNQTPFWSFPLLELGNSSVGVLKKKVPEEV